MVTLSKIYTKTGDGGLTRLVGGQQVDKDSLRIEAYGTVDELNAVMGMARCDLADDAAIGEADGQAIDAWFGDTQQRLFDLGSDLATYIEDRWETQPIIRAADVEGLERFIDEHNANLGVLKSFVLPGGTRLNASLHLARTVCRRAERRAIALAHVEAVGEHVVPYLNRLSDALFVLSRRVVQLAGAEEVLWQK